MNKSLRQIYNMRPEKPRKLLSNYADMLINSGWGERIRYNKLTGTQELDGEPWDNVATSDIRQWFEQQHSLKPSKGDVEDVTEYLARKNSFDPLEDYFRKLKWDGVERMDTWLATYLGVVGDVDYIRAVGRSVLISGAGRALYPGCKVDTMLLLQGAQGTLKSTAIKVLCPNDDWHEDNLGDIRHKDAEIQLGSVFIQEISELASFKRADIETLKSFLSRSETKIRGAYERHWRKVKRRNIFIGTTNAKVYLYDDTGNRRFYPAEVGSRIQIAKLEADRDQLWAEACAAFLHGEGWVIRDERILEMLEDQRDRAQAHDPWEEIIDIGISNGNGVGIDSFGRNYTTVRDVMRTILDMPVERVTRGHEMRVASILATLGWRKSERCRISGVMVRPWVKENI